MLRFRLRLKSSVILGVTVALTSAATPAAQRTFVSGNGSDSDPCSIVAPCRSFAAALAKTDPNGEIIVLDSAGYGAVVVSQSVSIIAPPGVYAGIAAFPSSPNGNGITIGGTVRVTLRGLTINGQGSNHGIQVLGLTGAPVVHIEDCVVSNHGDDGIHITGPVNPAVVFIGGTTVRGNGSYGIYASGLATVTVDRARIERNDTGIFVVDGPTVTVADSVIAGNASDGMRVHSFNGVSTTAAAISGSTVSGNGSIGIYGDAWTAGNLTLVRTARNSVTFNAGSGVAAEGLNGGTIVATVSDNLVTDNSFGIYAYGGSTTLTASNNSVSGNTAGLRQALSALFKTRNNNTVQDNTTDVSGTTTVVAGD
jgi:parallel beta-helix repeat protein